VFNQPAGTSADQLHITGLDEEPRVYPLSNNSVTIGRLPENDVVLTEDSVSSRHARLEKNADGWHVIDLNSTNGTYLGQQELSPQVLHAWSPDTPLNIGPYTLTWQTAVIHPTMPMPSPVTAAPSSPVAQPANGGASNLGNIRLDPISVSLAPGSQATVEVHAVNEARHVEQYLVGIEGLPASWIQLHEERVQLMPNYQETIFHFVLRVPPQNALAQTYPYRLVLRSVGDQREEGNAFGNLLVQPVPRFRASLNPRKIKNKGNCQVVIQNEGNAPAHFVVSGHDENEAVAFAKAMQQITVPAGQEERVQFQIEAVNRPLTGKATAASFEFRVQPDRGEAQIAKGDLDIQPRLPARLIVFLALLLGVTTTIPAITLPFINSLVFSIKILQTSNFFLIPETKLSYTAK
jgi:hypothetical protein